MILLIDAGNSRIKWGLWHAGEWLKRGVLPVSEAGRLEDVLVDAVGEVDPSWVGICCVAGEPVRVALRAILARFLAPSCWLQASREAFGVRNEYVQPETLGADRFANLIACRGMVLGPCLVVSLGTAVTIDALTAEGQFLGGLILPGAQLMRQALQQATAGVVDVRGVLQAYPACTGDAVESGIAMALSGAIEQFRAQFSSRFAADASSKVEVILTGGDASWIAALVPPPQRQIQDLVLEGLVWVARAQGVQGI